MLYNARNNFPKSKDISRARIFFSGLGTRSDKFTDDICIRKLIASVTPAILDFRGLISLASYLVYIVDALLKEDRSFGIKFRYERAFCESRFVLITMSSAL